MFAVIKTGGKQYKVSRNDVITVEKLPGAPGDTITFDTVLMVGGDTVTVGAPLVAGASVAGALVEQGRSPKTISFFKRRRQNSKRKKGHRQDLTVVRITDILLDGAKPAKAAAAKPAAAKAGINDNISLIDGLSKDMEKKLRAAYSLTLKDIAAWTAADIEKFDAEFKLKGRVTREEWPVQAQELLDGKPPRAKIDREEWESGKDL
jgi:large subunit ribosomal protein L21